MKRATVYVRKGLLMVCPSSQTTDGVWMIGDSCTTLDAAASTQQERGASILQALSLSKCSIPHPSVWGGQTKALLNAAGVKSWATFAKSAKSVSIEAEGDEIALIPLSNEGAGTGFVEIESATTRLDRRVSDVELGRALDAALRVAT